MPEGELSLDEKLRRINRLILDIEDAKSQRDRKVGERDSVLSTLRVQFNLNSLAEAKKKIAALDQQVLRRNAKIDEMYMALTAKYEI